MNGPPPERTATTRMRRLRSTPPFAPSGARHPALIQEAAEDEPVPLPLREDGAGVSALVRPSEADIGACPLPLFGNAGVSEPLLPSRKTLKSDRIKAISHLACARKPQPM